jgi:hypothetical protein
VTKHPEDILSVLGKMKEHELAMAEYYQVCSQVWSTEKEFWAEMEQSELRHANHIEKMIGSILKGPENFEWGHPFKLAAIQTATTGIKSDIQKLKAGGFTMYQTFFRARDIEQSILEMKYGEVIKTQSQEFQALLKEIVSETIDHRNQLGKKIKEWAE